MEEDYDFSYGEKQIRCDKCRGRMKKHPPFKQGERRHVISWSTYGKHCSDPECEINHICGASDDEP